jgi:hypothetical protein
MGQLAEPAIQMGCASFLFLTSNVIWHRLDSRADSRLAQQALPNEEETQPKTEKQKQPFKKK